MKSLNQILIATVLFATTASIIMSRHTIAELSVSKAALLYGTNSMDYTHFYDRWCYDIPECDDDVCSGGAFSCGTHLYRLRQQESQFPSSSQCVGAPTQYMCECWESSLRYTCSFVFAGCQYDEEENECVETEGSGFQFAPQDCQAFCWNLE